MQEITLNLHIHTNYSDGSLPHAEVAKAAIRCGLDAIMVTDHNIRPEGLQGYYDEGGKKVLVMIGEEIHNQDRQPQKSHLLAFGANRDLASFAADPQLLIQKVNQSDGISFLAHPYDPALPAFGEDNISWDDWDVKGYTGIELWNGFSELKLRAHNKWQAVFYAFFPKLIAHQPPLETLKIWNDLLASGKKVAAVGGSDSHASHYHMGPLHKIIFPYEFHFRAINTHVLLQPSLTGDAEIDSRSIVEALKQGHAFVGYDLPASTRGFQFRVETDNESHGMGDEIKFQSQMSLKIHLPGQAECQLLKDGELLACWKNQTDPDFSVKTAGVYRVECYRRYLGKKRGWIFSNPIYIR
jgi:hypothetical protein